MAELAARDSGRMRVARIIAILSLLISRVLSTMTNYNLVEPNIFDVAITDIKDTDSPV